MQQIGRHSAPHFCLFWGYFWENEYNCNYVIASKLAKRAIFKRRNSIAWPILVRNEMWVAKVLFHIKFQNFWESVLFSTWSTFHGSWKPQNWAIFKRQTSINWSILVRIEMWVAKVLLHINLQNFWESWFFWQAILSVDLENLKNGPFLKCTALLLDQY